MALGHFDQAKGVPEDLYDQLRASQTSAPVFSIEVGARERDLDKKTVTEIYESIETNGLISPIGIRSRKNGDGKIHNQLVYGYHRYAAWKQKLEEAHANNDEELVKRWNLIPVIWYPEEMSDDMALLVEVKENLERKELTDAERKSAMGKKAQLLKKIRPGKVPKTNKVPKVPTWAPPTMKVQAESVGVPYKTFRKWYDAYKAEHHKKAWNKQTEKEYDAFLQWLADAEKREQEAQEAAAADAQAETYTKALADVQKRMAQLVSDYGAPARNDLQEYANGL